MARVAEISPMGLYNWDNTIFDLFQTPTELNRDTLINNILAETIELEVLYPNPTVFKNLLGVWSSKQLPIWEKLYATTQYDYNPIENYNRYETGSQTGSGSTTHSGTDTTAETSTQGGMDTHSDALTNGGSDQRTETNALSGTDRIARENELGGSDSYEENTTHSGEDVDTGVRDSAHWIAGFNSVASGTDDGLVKQTKDNESAENRHDYGEVVDKTAETTYGKTESGTENTTYGKTQTDNETTTYGKTENRTGNIAYGKTETKNGTLTHGESITTENDGEHSLHAHGNIGVTTTQKLIREQREVDKFNLYDIIIDEFKMRFCILVY